MLKIKRFKGVMIGIIIAAMLLVCFISILSFKGQSETRNNNANVNAASVYRIIESNTHADDNINDHTTALFNAWYSGDYDTFTVDSIGALYTLTYLIHTNRTSTKPVTFIGKTIKLTSDLNLSSFSINSFYCYPSLGLLADVFFGTFDGQGHTISNYNHPGDGGAVCAKLCNGGVIKNLKMSNTIFTTGYSRSGVGVICGEVCANATVDSCIVDNVTINTSEEKKNYNLGVIAGINSGTVSNCIVMGDIKVNATKSSAGANCYAFAPSGTITDCLYRGNMTYSGSSNFSLDITMPNSCRNQAGEPTGFDYSTKGGDEEEEVWYWANKYNSNWPMLRVFISSWREVRLSVANSNIGSFSEDIVYIPQYTLELSVKLSGTMSNKTYNRTYTNATYNLSQCEVPFDIYSYSVDIYLKDDKYNKENVSCTIEEYIDRDTSNLKYWEITADLAIKTLKIKFGIASVDGSSDKITPIINIGATVHAYNENMEFEVAYGTTIYASHSTGTGISLWYQFKNIDGTLCIVTYELKATHRLDNNNNPGTITENHTNPPITPTIGSIGKCRLTLKGAAGSDRADDYTAYIVQGETLTIQYNTHSNKDRCKVGFTNAETSLNESYYYNATYDDNEMWILTSIKIEYEKDGKSDIIEISQGSSEVTYITINQNYTITPTFVQLFKVSFQEVENTTLSTSYTESSPLIMRNGEEITSDYSGYVAGNTSTLYYKYNSSVVATFTIAKGYNVKNTNSGVITSNKVITPTLEKNTVTISFEDATVNGSDITISPKGTETSFTVERNTIVKATPEKETEGPCTLTYEFAGKTVTYSIPSGYKIKKLGNTGNITQNTTISPTVELIKYTVTFMKAEKGCDKPEKEVEVNASDLPYLKFTCNETSCSFIIETYNVKEDEFAIVCEETYTAESGFVFDYALIDNDRYGYLHNFSVKDDMEIQPYFLQLFTIMFTNSEGANLDGGKDSVTVTVKEGSEITASTSTHVPGQESTVTYNIKNNYGNVLEQVNYTIDKRYIVTKTNAIASVSEDATISPVCQLAYFILKFANAEGTESEDVISPNLTEEFAVEIGTSEVQLSASPNTEQNGPFKLVYTFGGNSVEYEIPKEYKLVDLGKVGEIKEDTVITPVVKYITYEVVFAAVDGSEEIEEKITVAYGAMLLFGLDYKIEPETYCAVRIIDDLGVNFDKQYNAIYSQTVGEDKWVINKIRFAFEDGTVLVDEAEEGKLVYNGAGDSELEDISITCNLTIIPEFISMWDITFESGKGATLEGGDKKTITVKDGQSITAVAPGYVVGETSTMKYKVEENLDVATYTIEKHYKVANTKSIEAVHGHTTIIPECSLYSREVKFVNNHSDIASILDSNSLLDSNYSMFVDYDTTVSFSVSTQNGVLCYNYKFEYDGKNLGTITFVMINNKYAMLFEGEDRSKLINGLNSEDSYKFSASDTSGVTIIPEFARKIYNVEVS